MGGGGGGGGLSKIGTALAIIFAISLVVLFAELFYVLWRRRVFRRQTNPDGGGGGVEVSQYSSSDSSFSSIASSKELLYFFCIRPQFCFDRHSVTANATANDLNSNQQSDMEVVDIDLLKIQGMFGPPRFLFTIREEEREDMESPAEKSLHSAAEKEVNKETDDYIRSRVSLEECFKAAEESVVAVEIDDDCGVVDDATPYSTPCDSPVYFTPSASPVHDVVSGRSPEAGVISST
ncbi:hypothetical protein Salat_1023600 [Sesamum alatum]|uniref:Uncharacterized protein n=1 Tax=Sesamum alatum TaxID=300844 RepID=A0AAE1YLK9_9LAMI|nr:hypothetical protein Salat_1023600 [Sesamum alatum]